MQKATLFGYQDINAIEWNQFVMSSPQGNIYHLYEYLSHLMPNWQAVILREGEQIQAVFPFQISVKWGVQYAIQPHFSQYLGVLLENKKENKYKNLEFQKKAIQLIHEVLPSSLRYISYNFAPEFDYDLAFKWLGWEHKTNYTYWVDISKGYDVFLAESASHVRREAKKATQNGIEIRVENEPDKVIEILKTAKPEAVRNIHPHFFKALSDNSKHFFETQKSCCLIAYHEEKAVAGIIYFFHNNKMIYYQGSTLPTHKNSGAMTLIITESVRLFGGQYQFLDFDGSMIEPIERFFRGFGGFPIRYSNFTLNQLPFWAKIGLFLKSII
jgi:hypothetical protein